MKKRRSLLKLLIMVAAVCFICSLTAYAQDYYVSNDGNDSNNGTSKNTPWKTVNRVNIANFKPGDTVKFRCGDIWREQLRPIISGTNNSYITYTSYEYTSKNQTIKDKPLFLGSISANDPLDWKNEGNNIWSLNVKKNEIKLSTMAVNNGAATITTSSGIYGLNCSLKTPVQSKGNTVFTNKFDIKVNKYYLITFDAKTDSGAYKIPDIIVRHKDYSSYWNLKEKGSALEVNSVEKNYKVYFKSLRTSNDAVISFNLGDLPKNFNLYIKNIRLYEFNELIPIKDVGNIIFDDGRDFGIKVQNVGELKKQNCFWYDDNNDNIKLVSNKNPAVEHKKIEIAISDYIVGQWKTSNIIYNNLEFKYGGASGMQIGYSSNTIVDSCKLSYIGGGYGMDGKGEYTYDESVTGKKIKVRFGNGITFWQGASNNLVKNCNVSQIYDSGLATELWADGISQSNITFINNTVSNCEMSFGFINKGANSIMQGINFINNNCYNAGDVWSHSQRPNIGTQKARGVHVTGELGPKPSARNVTKKVLIEGNIFSRATGKCIDMYVLENMYQIDLSNNRYYQPQGGDFAHWKYKGPWDYGFKDFSQYQKDTGEDLDSTLTEIE